MEKKQSKSKQTDLSKVNRLTLVSGHSSGEKSNASMGGGAATDTGDGDGEEEEEAEEEAEALPATVSGTSESFSSLDGEGEGSGPAPISSFSSSPPPPAAAAASSSLDSLLSAAVEEEAAAATAGSGSCSPSDSDAERNENKSQNANIINKKGEHKARHFHTHKEMRNNRRKQRTVRSLCSWIDEPAVFREESSLVDAVQLRLCRCSVRTRIALQPPAQRTVLFHLSIYLCVMFVCVCVWIRRHNRKEKYHTARNSPIIDLSQATRIHTATKTNKA